MRSLFIDITRDDAAATVARHVVAEGVAPTCAAGWARPDAGIFVGGAADAIFDLASLTKPMTAVAVARSPLSPSTRLGDVLLEAKGTTSEEATIEHLLAHRAGLEPHVQLWLREPATTSDLLREAANARRPEATGTVPVEGFAPLYSDLGPMLVGAALARTLGLVDAGAAIEALVVRPLGLEDELGTARALEARGVGFEERVVPTEHAPWRGGSVRGRVHDENAWALTDAGGSGHAGMFGTAGAVLTFALDVLLHVKDLGWLVRERPGGTLRAGFDGKSAHGSSAGTVCGPNAFGHLGFTGTSFWIDPDAGAVVALLTNRVSPTRDNTKIRGARPVAHDALFRAALAFRRATPL